MEVGEVWERTDWQAVTMAMLFTLGEAEQCLLNWSSLPKGKRKALIKRWRVCDTGSDPTLRHWSSVTLRRECVRRQIVRETCTQSDPCGAFCATLVGTSFTATAVPPSKKTRLVYVETTESSSRVKIRSHTFYVPLGMSNLLFRSLCRMFSTLLRMSCGLEALPSDNARSTWARTVWSTWAYRTDVAPPYEHASCSPHKVCLNGDWYSGAQVWRELMWVSGTHEKEDKKLMWVSEFLSRTGRIVLTHSREKPEVRIEVVEEEGASDTSFVVETTSHHPPQRLLRQECALLSRLLSLGATQ